MKKQLIATLVAALIIFIWQFLSWGAINFHSSESQYTDKQDAILQMLSQNLKTGSYQLPMPAPNSSAEEQKAMMENMAGKPWATISYHEAYDANMGMNLIRGFVIDILAAFLLVWLLGKMANPSFQTILLSSLAVGFIGYFTIPYLYTIWYETSSLGYLIDAIGQWGIVGLWLGWFLNRR